MPDVPGDRAGKAPVEEAFAYDASCITILDGLEAVRLRPSMYIGSTDSYGLHRLAFEVIDNAVDEILSGYGSEITVTVTSDNSLEVVDNGRGIPVEPHSRDGRPACEVVLTTLHAGAKFDKTAYSLSSGLLGVGLSCVNALSQRLRLEVRRSGVHYRQHFQYGKATGALEVIGAAHGRGTAIHFLPDSAVFGGQRFSGELLADRLEGLAFLNPGLRLRLEDLRSGLRETYHFQGGVEEFVAHRNRQRTPLHPRPIVVEAREEGLAFRIALQWTRGYAEDVLSYVNCVRTSDGGSHVDGIRSALVRTLDAHARRRGLLTEGDDPLQTLDVFEGLTCVLSVELAEPIFEGPTKSRLRQQWVGEELDRIASVALEQVLLNSPEVAAAVIGRALDAARSRRAVRLASDRVRYQVSPLTFDEEIYRGQFSIRSSNWHDSATWITDEELLAAHVAFCQVSTEARLLDVCCGSGVVGAAFRGRVGHTTGLDLTPAMARLAGTRLDEVHLGNVYDLPFLDESYDIVVTREVLHLLPRPEVPVREIHRVLRPGGQFVVGQTLPYDRDDAAWMWRVYKKKQPLLYNMFTYESFKSLLGAAGFRIAEVRDLFVWEDIDRWIDTHETSNLHRHQIRGLYRNAPAMVRSVHPFEVTPGGRIRDRWRWGVFSAFKRM